MADVVAHDPPLRRPRAKDALSLGLFTIALQGTGYISTAYRIQSNNTGESVETSMGPSNWYVRVPCRSREADAPTGSLRTPPPSAA